MPAYGQTNVKDDPNYWLATLAGRRHDDPIRIQAEQALARIQHQEQMGATRANLLENVAARREALGQSIADRQERARQMHLDRMERAKETATYRKDVLDARAAAQKSEDDARLMAILPEIQQQYGKQGQAITKQIMDRYLASKGLNVNAAAPQDEGDKAIARIGAQQGRTPVQPQAATTTAPTAGDQQQGGAPTFAPSDFSEPATPKRMVYYHWTQGTGGVSGGNDAGMHVVYDDGSSEWVPTATPGRFPQQLPPVQRNVEGGNVVGPLAKQVPAGYDLNFNTGRLVPQSTEGTFNGVPINRALVEGALKTGVRPIYSPGAMNVLDQMGNEARNRLEATTGHGAKLESGEGVIRPTGFAPANLTQTPTTPPPTAPAPTQPPTAEGGGSFTPYGTPTGAGFEELAKSVGQGLLPSVFGYPAGTQGAERLKPPPPPPPIVEKKKKDESEG